MMAERTRRAHFQNRRTMMRLLLVLFALKLLGVYLFGVGFFLTRYSMKTTNVCAFDSTQHDTEAFRPPSHLVRHQVWFGWRFYHLLSVP
jgi:hypothetical protein